MPLFYSLLTHFSIIRLAFYLHNHKAFPLTLLSFVQLHFFCNCHYSFLLFPNYGFYPISLLIFYYQIYYFPPIIVTDKRLPLTLLPFFQTFFAIISPFFIMAFILLANLFFIRYIYRQLSSQIKDSFPLAFSFTLLTHFSQTSHYFSPYYFFAN